MHELSLCKNMIEIILTHANQISGKKIKIIYIEIGELIAIEPAAFLFCFDIIKKGTILEDTELNMITILGQAYCDYCQRTVQISSYHQSCASCDHFSLKIISGQGLRIRSMVVE